MPKKIQKSKRELILELPVRKKVFLIVKKYAGCHFREIERKSKLSTGVVKYHLDYLVKNHIIRQEKTDNNVRYFPKELSSEEETILGLLRSKTVRTIIIHLVEQSKCTHKQLVTYLGLSPSTVSWHLKKLVEKDVITVTNNDYQLKINTNIVIKLLITYRETFFDALVDRAVETWG